MGTTPTGGVSTSANQDLHILHDYGKLWTQLQTDIALCDRTLTQMQLSK
ncbi:MULTISPECIES: hypothetical protein [Fischerella]|nr:MULTISPECIES: hypothetical protein [Fischerella]MBD2433276.1 hypothetical protein [Fischerella sp. FACHB-380]